MNNNIIAVIGSTNWDICLYLPHLPAPGETVGDGRLKGNIGGKGANQAIACQRAGAQVNFISAVGDDSTGREIVKQLDLMGLDTSCIEQISGASTGTACIFIAGDGENCIGLSAGANARLTREIAERYQQLVNAACVLLMQLEIPLDTILHMAELARAADTRVVLNPAPARSLPAQLFPLLDVITPNCGELARLSGLPVDSRENIQRAASSLLQKGVGCVIVTLGKDGAVIFDQDKKQGRFFPAHDVPVVDTTAAGDVFNGVFCTALAQNESYDRAVKRAIAAAAISVGREGAIPSIPSAEEIQSFAMPEN